MEGIGEKTVSDAAFLFMTEMTRSVLKAGYEARLDPWSLEASRADYTAETEPFVVSNYITLAAALNDVYPFYDGTLSLDAGRQMAKEIQKHFPSAVRWNRK